MAFFCSYIIIELYFVPRMIQISHEPLSVVKLCLEVLVNCIPAIFFAMIVFFFYLHSFLNFWSELLRFGDRMFYTDWWNAPSYSFFYKTWNVVVQDWLRTYVFIELRYIIPVKGRNAISSIFVLTFSSIIHEYIMSMIVGSFCPAVTIAFGVFGGYFIL
ncbi:hypothetical protein MXB_1037 [Myxobolus squamalis]|nr:hypothetical protein MXB_1037 [Myxobolus squamalis]